MQRSVRITTQGRAGEVLYAEPAGNLAFWWEFAGGDALAIVNVGTAAEWQARHPWAVARRAEILRYVAAEIVRQKAAGGRAEIDEARGWITLKPGSAAGPPGSGPRREFSMDAWRRMRERAAKMVLAVTLVLGGLLWIKEKVLVIDPGTGAPLGDTVRTGRHLATLVQSLVPYTPSLNRDHGKDRYRLSLLIVPLDGGRPRLVDLPGEAPASSQLLSRVLGGDDEVLWFDAGGLGAVDLRSYELVDPRRLRGPPPAAPPVAFGPKVADHLGAGFRVSADQWLGLHSDAEVAGEFAPGKWLRRVARAVEKKELRRFHRATLGPDAEAGTGALAGLQRILSMTPVGDQGYVGAAFLRLDAAAEPLRMRDPDGALMVYTSDAGLKGTTVMARVDTAGKLLWKADTGIDRFTLRQVLPGLASTVFVGTRPPVPGKVSEPLLVIVDHASGATVTHSLWR